MTLPLLTLYEGSHAGFLGIVFTIPNTTEKNYTVHYKGLADSTLKNIGQ